MTAAVSRRRRLARWLLVWGALLLVAYVAVFICLWIVQERIVFKLRPLSPQQADEVRAAFPEARSVRIGAADSTPIHAWYRPASPAASPRRLVLYFGANNDQVHWQLARAGSNAVARADKLVVMGTSMGSYVATYLAASHAVDGVVLVVPYDSVTGIAQSMIPIYPIAWILRHRFETIAEAPKVRAPTLFIVAMRDNFVPLARSRRVYDAWGSSSRQWVELKDANHHTAPADPLYWERLGAFLREL